MGLDAANPKKVVEIIMQTVMISGSKSINFISDKTLAELKNALNKIISYNWQIIIGDCCGVDFMIQNYLKSQNYQNVVVYYALFDGNGKCRNNAGFKTIGVEGNYTERDKFMCKLASHWLAIWDGKSRGTKANIDRMQGKFGRLFVCK